MFMLLKKENNTNYKHTNLGLDWGEMYHLSKTLHGFHIFPKKDISATNVFHM